MPDLSAEQCRALAALQRAYRADLVERVTKVVAAAESLRPGRRDRRGRQDLRNLAHRLAGSAGICGFTALGQAASRLEDAVLSAGADPVTIDLVAELRRLSRALRRAAGRSPSAFRPSRARSTPASGRVSRAAPAASESRG
jgi:HPt (histidine-containing phosphotransfer) domain-containing protein